MFTGIVEEVGTVREALPGALVVAARNVLEGTSVGDSIAVNGACLTVVRLYPDGFAVDLMPETVRHTNLGALGSDDSVNLERALALSDRLGGHWMQGHVEGTGRLVATSDDGDAVLVRYAAPPSLMRYIVPKGFIAVDGVSLTVAERDEVSFLVSLVAFTQTNTNLLRRQPGDLVNLETDILARYVEQLLKASEGQG